MDPYSILCQCITFNDIQQFVYSISYNAMQYVTLFGNVFITNELLEVSILFF